MNLLVYSVAAFGVAYVVGFAAITQPIRTWLDQWPRLRWVNSWAGCPACFGAWEGGICAAIGIANVWPTGGTALAILGTAAYTVGSNFMLARMFGLMPSPLEGEDE